MSLYRLIRFCKKQKKIDVHQAPSYGTITLQQTKKNHHNTPWLIKYQTQYPKHYRASKAEDYQAYRQIAKKDISSKWEQYLIYTDVFVVAKSLCLRKLTGDHIISLLFLLNWPCWSPSSQVYGSIDSDQQQNNLTQPGCYVLSQASVTSFIWEDII